MQYSCGLWTEDCGTKLDHAVLVVGYGTDADSGKECALSLTFHAFVRTGDDESGGGGGDGNDDDADCDDGDELSETHEQALLAAMMPESLRWLARADGVTIPVTKMGTPEEKQLFKDNYLRPEFRSSSASSNAHSAIDFGLFAKWWNERIDELERKRGFTHNLLRKTGLLLRAYYKERARIINIATTIAQQQDASGETLRERNFELYEEFRAPSRGDGCFQPAAGLQGRRSRTAAMETSCLHCPAHCPSSDANFD